MSVQSLHVKSLNLLIISVNDPVIGHYSLEDLGGCARRTPPPPKGSRFFRFDIQNFRNVTASGVHAPPTRSGNPGSWIRHCYLLIVTINYYSLLYLLNQQAIQKCCWTSTSTLQLLNVQRSHLSIGFTKTNLLDFLGKKILTH